MAMVTVTVGLIEMYTDVGMSTAIIHRQDTTKEQISSLYWLNIITGLVIFSLFWVSIPLIAQFYSEPRLPPLLRAVAIVFLIIPICSQFEILLQKELLFDALARRNIWASVGQTCVAITLAALGFGVWSLIYAFLVAAVLRVVLLLRVGFSRYCPTIHFNWLDVKGYLRSGLFQIGERTAYYTSQRSDHMLIGSVLGAEALGNYSFAFNLVAQPLSRINPILTRVALPVFSQLQNDPVKLKIGYTKLVSILTTINAPLLIGLAVVAPWAVPTIFGSNWSQSIPILQILSLVTLLRTINNPAGSLLYAKGRVDLTFSWHVMTLVLSVPLAYVGCLIGTPVSVAMVMLVLQLFLAVPMYLLLIRPLIGRCAQEYSRVILWPITIALMMGIAVYALSWNIPTLQGAPMIALQIIVGGLLYFALLRVICNDVFIEIKSALINH